MLQNLTIGKRLGFGFAALAALLLAIGIFAVERLGTTQQAVHTLTNEAVPSIRDLGHMTRSKSIVLADSP